jgi:MFS family permease
MKRKTRNPGLRRRVKLVMFNIVYALASLPAGIVSDKLGRRRLIIIGWLVYAVVYIGFAVANAEFNRK